MFGDHFERDSRALGSYFPKVMPASLGDTNTGAGVVGQHHLVRGSRRQALYVVLLVIPWRVTARPCFFLAFR